MRLHSESMSSRLGQAMLKTAYADVYEKTSQHVSIAASQPFSKALWRRQVGSAPQPL